MSEDPKQTPGQPPTILAPVQTRTPDVTVDTVVAPPATVPPVVPAIVPPPVGDTTSRAVSIGDDGEIPGDAELLTLSKRAFNSRLDRHTKAELRSRFGTDNPDEIKTKLDQLATYEAERETARLAALSDLERANEAKARAEGERDEWKRQHDELRDTQLVRTAHSRVERIAASLVKPKMQKYALGDFQSYLTGSLSDEEIDRLTDDDITKWFAAKVVEMPEWSKDFALPAPPPPIPNVPLTNGPPAGNQAPPPTGAAAPQSYSPSAANPMGRGEAVAAARKEGYHW